MYFSVIVFYDCKILDMHESSRNRKLFNITQTLGGPRLNYVDCINICILVVIKISISHDEACEVAIGVIRRRGQPMIYTTLYRKVKTEQQEPQ